MLRLLAYWPGICAVQVPNNPERKWRMTTGERILICFCVIQQACGKHRQDLSASEQGRLNQLHRAELPRLEFEEWLALRVCAKALSEMIGTSAGRRENYWNHMRTGLRAMLEEMDVPQCFGARCGIVSVDIIWEQADVQKALKVIQNACEESLEAAQEALRGEYELDEGIFRDMSQWLYAMVLMCHVHKKIHEGIHPGGESEGAWHWEHTFRGDSKIGIPCIRLSPV